MSCRWSVTLPPTGETVEIHGFREEKCALDHAQRHFLKREERWEKLGPRNPPDWHQENLREAGNTGEASAAGANRMAEARLRAAQRSLVNDYVECIQSNTQGACAVVEAVECWKGHATSGRRVRTISALSATGVVFGVGFAIHPPRLLTGYRATNRCMTHPMSQQEFLELGSQRLADWMRDRGGRAL